MRKNYSNTGFYKIIVIVFLVLFFAQLNYGQYWGYQPTQDSISNLNDTTDALRDEINALTDTAGVHLDTLLSHNNRILALLDSILSHYSAAEINLLLAAKYNSADFNNDFDTRLAISSIMESQISDLQNYLLTESDPIWISDSGYYYKKAYIDALIAYYYTKTEADNLLAAKFDKTDTLDYYKRAYVDALLNYKLNSADTLSLSNRINSKSDTAHTHVEADITNLDHYTDADIDGSETAFNGWDKDASNDVTTSTSFGGDVSGTYNNLQVTDDSHNHVISNVDNLQTTLDSLANKYSWGNPAGGMLFDGTDDYASFAFTIPIKGFQVWVYPTVTNKAILTFGTNMSVTFNGSNVVTYGSSFANVTTWINGVATTTLKLNEWNFIVATFDEITPTVLELGRSSSTYFTGIINLFRPFNRALTITDAKIGYNNGRPDLASLSYADIGASQTDLMSGWDFTSGWTAAASTIDDANTFTTVAAGGVHKSYSLNNYIGKRFRLEYALTTSASSVTIRLSTGSPLQTIVTGSTSGTVEFVVVGGLSNYNLYLQNTSAGTTDFTTLKLTQIGCVAEYKGENMGRLGVIETMNGLHGSTSGSPVSLNAEQRPVIYRDVKLAIANTATTLTNIVPRGYRIASIRAVGSDSLTAIKIGTSSGGEQVVASETTTGTAPKLLTLATTANDGYSESAATTLYAEHGTSGQTLDLIFTFEKVDR